MVTKQVPWRYGNPATLADAKIAFSTALSLNILQHLRSDLPRAGLAERIWAFFKNSIPRPTTDIADPGQLSMHQWQAELETFVEHIPTPNPDALNKWIDALRQRSTLKIPGTSRNAHEESSRRLKEAACPDLLRLLIKAAELDEGFTSGIGLKSYLEAVVADSREAIEIYVTGHSKGGALSSTLALWLADTQGRDHVRDEDLWDPEKKAQIYAYSFAGPTAGNG
jgi:hypothetical protein